MNEVLVINKPKDYTSRDVVNFVCKKFKTKKVGHTGTLDPMATGVLVILIGKYTSLVEVITAYDKVYEAEVTLGTLTNTLDSTGEVLKEENVSFKKEQIIEALNKMTKTYEQTVPIYSAVKINGKKLYEYARNNEKIELPKRKVTIKSLELISDIKEYNGKVIFKIRTKVSKGTYIRALVADIAQELGTIGIMSSLKRIRQGDIDISDSYTLEELENGKYEFYDLNKCFNNIYQVELDDELYNKIKNGVQIPNTYNHDIVLFKYNNSNVALYKDNKNILKMWKYLL